MYKYNLVNLIMKPESFVESQKYEKNLQLLFFEQQQQSKK